MKRVARVVLAGVVASMTLVALGDGAKRGALAADVKWGYSGAGAPDKWGELSPQYAACKTGKNQTPIDIKGAVVADDLAPITFDYKPSPLRIIDNGHTIQVNYAPGSSIAVAGRRYELVQFHFHKPAEERVNGKAYDMDAHLVHRDKDRRLAVVGVLLAKGSENPVIRTLWSNLPKTKEKEQVVDAVTIDAGGLLPADRGYYTFAGSLTTPPCSEDVTWFVLKTPVPLSAAQIEQFGTLYKMNARNVQPLNGRVVKSTK
ncbi:MAG TPA: carbonic anhydrase [Methylomirabilota bacterium]|jgi:carbonic anhydrase|nr:carbonic anhydrase [Methylomirabilota bacterium]